MTNKSIEENNDYIKLFLDEGTRLFDADLSIMVGTVAKIRNQAHQAGIDEAVEVIKEELRNAPLEIQMTKGTFFAKVIKALQDNK